MKVLLDTNFVIDTVRFKIDLDEISDLIGAHELVTLNTVERELVKISKGASRSAAYARASLKLLKELNIQMLKTELRPDDAMVKLADDTIVATNDIELRKRLKSLGKKTIYLKSKKHLAIG